MRLENRNVNATAVLVASAVLRPSAVMVVAVAMEFVMGKVANPCATATKDSLDPSAKQPLLDVPLVETVGRVLIPLHVSARSLCGGGTNASSRCVPASSTALLPIAMEKEPVTPAHRRMFVIAQKVTLVPRAKNVLPRPLPQSPLVVGCQNGPSSSQRF